MNLPETDRSPALCLPTANRRPWCALLVLWFFMPIAFTKLVAADDVGLINPVEKEFSEFQSDTRNSGGNFVQRGPVFQDRTLPIPNEPTTSHFESIRQVAAADESNDPFSMVSQPLIPPSSPDWGATVPIDPNNFPSVQPSLTQNTVIPYDPQIQSIVGYANPYQTMQGMSNMYPGGSEYATQFAQQQFAQQQFAQLAQYPQQVPMVGVNPYMNPYGLADPSVPFTTNFADPYGMYQMNFQPDVQDYQSLYLALLQQDNLQGGEVQGRSGNRTQQDFEEAKKQADANWTLNNLVPVRVSSPLGETLLACAKTVSPFYAPSGPDKGVGMPLVGKSWLDHPWYFGGFVGQTSGSDLVSKMIKQKSGGIGGLTVGYNFNDYWGLESRLNFAAIDTYDTEYAKELFNDLAQGGAVLLPASRTNNLTFLDAAVHYYPLGNAKWRPYFKYGLGFGQQKYVNIFGNQLSDSVITMPFGMGMRYWWNERIAIQMDLVDNIIFASGISKTQNNFALTLGLTYACGSGKRVQPYHYWPATPSMGTKW